MSTHGGRLLPLFSLVLNVFALPALAGEGPEVGPLVCGRSSYVDGTFVATDYVYDDRGPDTDVQAGGDASYPAGLENGADLVQVQVALVGGEVRLRAILQTLVDPAVPMLAFVLDTDADPATGAPTIPGSSWSPSAPLGAELLVAVTSLAARVFEWSGGAWIETALLPSVVDATDNLVEVSLPVGVVDAGGATWRMFGLAGLSNASILAGGTIYDLAFLRGETIHDRNVQAVDSIISFGGGETAMWQDHRQSAVLAGALDPEEAAATVDFTRVEADDTDLTEGTEPGWHTFLYRSTLELGEGIEGDVFAGPYQPYMVFRREVVPEPHPLVMFLHGAGSTHTFNTHFYQDDGGGAVFGYPGVTIFPLGRGKNLGYEGISEFDVLEALDDAMERMPVDPERVVLTGLSMGGIGTYKLASLYPDRFTAGISLVGYMADAPIENLLNVPFRASNGMIDYLVSAPLFLPDRDAGLALGYDFRFFDVANGHHTAQAHLESCVFDAALARDRVANPPRVIYSVEPHRFRSDPETGLELYYDSAYWVSGIAVRPGVAKGTVDVTSLARADRSTDTTVVDEVHQHDMRDYCGANADLLITDFPAAGKAWRERSVLHSPAPPQPVSNGLAVELTELEAVSFDLARASVSTGLELVLEVTGDGPADLTLLGNWGDEAVPVLRDGQPHGNAVPGSGELVLSRDFTGSHVWQLPEPGGLPGCVVAAALCAWLARRRPGR